MKAIKVDADGRKLSFSKIKAEQTRSKSRDVQKNSQRNFKASDDKSKRPSRKFDKPRGGKNSSGGKPQNRKPKELFNNPFAALKGLK